jgi:DNA-binding NtrC family response regulator
VKGAPLMSSTQSDRDRVLLVDDDVSLLVSLEALLADQFDVRTCTSGRVALYVLERETFHVVCSDWQMPGMTGLQLYQAMVSGRSKLEPSFILMSAHPSANDARARTGLSVTYLRKPIAPAEFLRVVTESAGLAKAKGSTDGFGLATRAARRVGD